MMRLPVRTRLTAVYCTVFCASTLLLECGAYVGLKSAIRSIVDRELEARTSGIVDFIDHHITKLSPAKFQKELSQHGALEPDYLVIQDSHGQFLWRPQRMERGDRGVLQIVATDVRIKGERYHLDIASDLSLPFEILSRFRMFAILSSPLVLAAASLLGYWIAGRALRPVAEMTAAARAIGAANLSDRLTVPTSNDEFHQLAETINDMLGRIENAFRQVTQFTANASHELRTPLAIMRTTAEVALLRTRPSIESYREALLRILEESEKNSALLDDMLRLARADSGARQLNLQPLDLRANLQEACDQLRPIAEDRALTLRFAAAPAVQSVVRGDAEHLRRLWLILLDNAIKYTASGGSIDIALVEVCDCVACAIQDTGIGIAAKDLSHIFERFYRSDKARKREQGGAGLGLSMAKWIVDAHHAQIEVESEPGTGSIFRVMIPKMQVSSKAAPIDLALTPAGQERKS